MNEVNMTLDSRLYEIMEADRRGDSREVSRLLYYMPDPTERATDPEDEPQAAAAAGAPASSSGQMQAAPMYAAGVAPPNVLDRPAPLFEGTLAPAPEIPSDASHSYRTSACNDIYDGPVFG